MISEVKFYPFSSKQTGLYLNTAEVTKAGLWQLFVNAAYIMWDLVHPSLSPKALYDGAELPFDCVWASPL